MTEPIRARIGDVTLRPEPPAWAAMLAESHPTDDARRNRRALGLPVGAPLVLAGHQPGFWHAGILAKWLALGVLAGRTNAAQAWVVVDQDIVDPWAIRSLDEGRPADRRLGSAPPGGVVAARAPTLRPQDRPSGIGRALADHADEPNAAMQAARANADLLTPEGRGPALIPATALSGAPRFGELLGRMRGDAGAMLRAYNEAARAEPAARIRPLRDDPDRGPELPVWRIDRAGRRAPVHARDNLDGDDLAPRAALLDALLRLDLCDLYISGLGGERYGRVTERWIDRWLGERLAPSVSASADVFPQTETDEGDRRTIRDAERAAWEAHAARHDPAMLGDDDAAREKRRLLGAIQSARTRGDDPAPAFRAMHELLERTRGANAEMLARMDEAAAALSAKASEVRSDAAPALDRTVAAAAWPASVRGELRDRIESALFPPAPPPSA